MWHGENRSGRMEPWKEGDLVRYDDGATALMRIEYVRDMGPDQPGCAPAKMNRWRYYGRAFHSEGSCIGRYHGQCLEPSQEDRDRWAAAHDPETDEWIRGAW